MSLRASSWQTICADFDGVGPALSQSGDESCCTVVVPVVAERSPFDELPHAASAIAATSTSGTR